MVGGTARSRAPREAARDPEAWPDAVIDDVAAAVVQTIARRLAAALTEHGWSRRAAADHLGVNRQTIGDVLDGRTWPDVATIARLEAGLNTPLWPPLARRQRCSHRCQSPSDPGQHPQ
ncbi:helix-turn-helix transcriptional regulator [Streptomyces sp. NPDC059009]|uniref:helix-turn-helix transcriptional regulator n=1 Tax=Streptomyces sp. NPDC059009 TaxID=3346694 RepID=UPI003673960C